MPLPSIKRNQENLTRVEHLACARPHAKYCTWLISFNPLNRHLREAVSLSNLQKRKLRAWKVNLPIKLQSWGPNWLPDSQALGYAQPAGVAHGCVLHTTRPSVSVDTGAPGCAPGVPGTRVRMQASAPPKQETEE